MIIHIGTVLGIIDGYTKEWKPAPCNPVPPPVADVYWVFVAVLYRSSPAPSPIRAFLAVYLDRIASG